MTKRPPASRVRPESLLEMEAHASETYPNECCGAVIDDTSGVQQVIRLRNVQDEMHARDPLRYPRTARTAYTPHAGEFKRAMDLSEAQGAKLVAFYHSHPDHDAYFSKEDVAQATPFGEPSYPEVLQVVVSVYGGRVKEVRTYRWSPAEGCFLETKAVGG